VIEDNGLVSREVPSSLTHGSFFAICVGIAVALPIIYTIVSLFILPTVYSDTATGFHIWEAMRRGAAFNYEIGPDPADISRDAQAFFTNWTPGQYVFPGLLELLVLSLGHSIILVVGIFSLLGAIGWLKLYGTLGFSPRVAGTAVVIVVCSRHFALPFGHYNGGEVLMFGAAPWFLLLIWRLRRFPWWALPVIVAASLALVFFKLTGALIAGAAIGAAVLATRIWPVTNDVIRKVAVAGASLLLFGLIFYYGWYVRGPTPATMTADVYWWKLIPHSAFALVALAWSSISLGDFSEYILFGGQNPLFTSHETWTYIVLPFSLAVLGYVWWRLWRHRPHYLRFVFWMALSFSSVLVWSWVHGGKVGEYEDRHFQSISLLLLPAIVEALTTARLAVARGCFWLFATMISLYGLSSFAVHIGHNLRYPLDRLDIRQNIASQGALDFFHRTDEATTACPSPLIYATFPEIGLDRRFVRLISTHADFETIEQLSSRRYHGRVPCLYVLIEAKLVDNGKAEAILKSFVDYPLDSWTKLPLDSFVAYSVTPN
jgi:hypothetical protein